MDHDEELIVTSSEVTPGHRQRIVRRSTPAEPAPELTRYRNNLTALSHKFNLYFVACDERILVFEPPCQTRVLNGQPLSTIEPPVKSIDLSFLWATNDEAHFINQILVGKLGDAEILLTAHHDGDVVAYYVQAIHHSALSSMPCDFKRKPKPFFHENVGISAWGLAIHQEARLIAVSSNERIITVFALALADVHDSSNEDGSLPSCSEEIVREENIRENECNTETEPPSILQESSDQECSISFPDDRRKTHTIRLAGAVHNVPSISFCNTDEDLRGRWIMGGDITGHTTIWDLHRRAIVWKSEKTAYCSQTKYCPCGERPPCHFHAVWCTMWLDKRSFAKSPSDQCDGSARPIPRPLVDAGHANLDPQDRSRRYVRWHNQEWLDPIKNKHYKFKTVHYKVNDKLDLKNLSDAAELPISFQSNVETTKLRKFAMPGPILIATKHDAFIVSWHQSQGTDETHYEIVCGAVRALRKPSQMRFVFADLASAHDTHNDRLNLCVQIPELAVVICGSAIGKVAVLTLHMRRAAIFPGVGSESTTVDTHSFEIWGLLPSEKDDTGRSQSSELIGVSASPVPGPLGLDAAGGRRRWRLVLLRSDWTVFTYELSRVAPDSLQVESLVV